MVPPPLQRYYFSSPCKISLLFLPPLPLSTLSFYLRVLLSPILDVVLRKTVVLTSPSANFPHEM